MSEIKDYNFNTQNLNNNTPFSDSIKSKIKDFFAWISNDGDIYISKSNNLSKQNIEDIKNILRYLKSKKSENDNNFFWKNIDNITSENILLDRLFINDYLENIVVTKKELNQLKQEVQENKEYNKKIEYLESDLLIKSSNFISKVDDKLQTPTSEFLKKYYDESLVYAWNQRVLDDQENHGWILNRWSHDQLAKIIASSVHEWLPSNIDTNLKYAIWTMIASAVMYLKETQDKNITPEDISIPIFVDLGNNNMFYLTFSPNGWYSIEFKLNNINKLNQTAWEYLSYVQWWVIKNFWDSKHKRDELRINVWVWIKDHWEIRLTSNKKPDNIDEYLNWNYKWSQVNILTYTEELLKWKITNTWTLSVSWTAWVQENKWDKKIIAWTDTKFNKKTDFWDFWTDNSLQLHWDSLWYKTWLNYQLPEQWPKIILEKIKNYLDPKTWIYKDSVEWEVRLPIDWNYLWVKYMNWKWSFDWENFWKNWDILWLTFWVDSWNTKIRQYVRDYLWWYDFEMKWIAWTNNSYWIDSGLYWKTGNWVIDYSVNWQLKNNDNFWNIDTINTLSWALSLDILKINELLTSSNTDKEQQIELVRKVYEDYWVKIEDQELNNIWPLNSLRLFALANQSIVTKETFITLWFWFN